MKKSTKGSKQKHALCPRCLKVVDPEEIKCFHCGFQLSIDAEIIYPEDLIKKCPRKKKN